MSKLGFHVKTGSRNGYGQVCSAKPAMVFSTGEGGALLEAKEKSAGHTWTFYRDISLYNDNPNLNNMTVAEAVETGKNIYPLLVERWLLNPADAYCVINETGANDPRAIKIANAYERTILELAEQDGYKLVICNLFSGSPDDGSVAGQDPNGGMETWKLLYADHIARAFEGGHFYGRHVYGFQDLVPLDHNSDRPFREAEWLDSQGLYGGIALTEIGLNGGQSLPSEAHMMSQITLYDALMRGSEINRKFIVGGAWWTYGDFLNVNIQGSSSTFAAYLKANESPTWVPPEYIPPEEKKTLKKFLWDEGVDKQTTCGIRLNDQAGLEASIREKGLIPVVSEFGRVYEENGQHYVSQAGEDLAHILPREHFVYEPGIPIWSFTDPYEPPVIPPQEFKLTHWPTVEHVITQGFGANPQNYAQYGLPGHNGWDIKALMGTAFFAPAPGIVVWASNMLPSDPNKTSDYGFHVRIDHGNGYQSILAHAAPDLNVQVGDFVQGGDIVGFSGNTGNSTGPHLHYEMRKCPGDPGWPWCIIDPWYLLEPLYDPPSTGGISMRPYWLPVTSGPGPFFVLQHSSGRTEDVQHQVSGNEVWVIKNRNYEHLRLVNGFVERREDTSPDPDTSPADFYLLSDNDTGWSRWCPEIWKPGDTFYREPDVLWFDRDCNLVKEDENAGSWLRFDRFHSTWVSPPSNASPDGIRLNNVVELSWRGSPEGPPIERYWLAKNIGYPIQWKNSAGAHSWISELPQGRDPLDREVIHCL